MEQGQGMSDNIKELVSRLRAFCTETRAINVRDVHVAADALETLVAERDRLKDEVEWVRAMATLVLDGAEALDIMEVLRAERDRLRNEKVAGGPRPEAMGGTPPATDPASAVCEWTRTPYTAMYSSTCCDENYLHKVTASGMCHRCDKPIKFTEAKE